jgi:hypothetical protein
LTVVPLTEAGPIGIDSQLMRAAKSLALLVILGFQVLTAWTGKCPSFTASPATHGAAHHESHQSHSAPSHHGSSNHCVCAAACNSSAVPGTSVTAAPLAMLQSDVRFTVAPTGTPGIRPAFLLPPSTAPPILA